MAVLKVTIEATFPLPIGAFSQADAIAAANVAVKEAADGLTAAGATVASTAVVKSGKTRKPKAAPAA